MPKHAFTQDHKNHLNLITTHGEGTAGWAYRAERDRVPVGTADVLAGYDRRLVAGRMRLVVRTLRLLLLLRRLRTYLKRTWYINVS